MIIRCAAWLTLGWAAFLAARALAKELPASPPWLGQVALKALLLAFSIAAMKLAGKSWQAYGFRPAPAGSWKRAVLAGAAMGAAASLTILLLGGKGMTSILRGFSFPAIVLTVWLWSSFTEEIFTRAWLQSVLPAWRWILSGLFFGSLHISVIQAGADAVTGPVILIATTLLGLWCGWLRERHQSIWPALYAHIAFNAGGALGGMIYAIQHMIRFGKPPSIG